MSQTIKQSPRRIVLDAIVRMSATRTNYWVEVVLDAVLCLTLFVAGWRHHTGGVATALLAFCLGLFVFSFIEYVFHRWMFHTHVP
jgi:hypothetical protein